MVQGENAWVFVSEECIAESVKSYHEFEQKLLEKYPKEQRQDMHPTSITGKQHLSAGFLSAHHKRLTAGPACEECLFEDCKTQVPAKSLL